MLQMEKFMEPSSLHKIEKCNNLIYTKDSAIIETGMLFIFPINEKCA